MKGLVKVGTAPSTSIQLLTPSVSLRETVESSLSAAILSGELAPGELVSVPTLATRFGISATPVREAMLDLEKRGFVVSVRNKGFRVTEVSEADLREIVQIRQWLECGAAEEVCANFGKASVDEFRALADKLVESADRKDVTTHVGLDIEFHIGLLRLADNARLVTLVTELRQQTRRVGLSHAAPGSLHRIAREHHEMLDLLIEGRAEAFRELLWHHIASVLPEGGDGGESERPSTSH